MGKESHMNIAEKNSVGMDSTKLLTAKQFERVCILVSRGNIKCEYCKSKKKSLGKCKNCGALENGKF